MPEPPSTPERTTTTPRADESAARSPDSTAGVRPASSRDPDGIPSRVGRYEVRERLGAGAFGSVYRAFDPELKRDVAIKVPKRDALTPELLARIRTEALAAAAIHHPNVCPIYDVGTDDDGVPLLVMRYVAGGTLDGAIKGRKKPYSARDAAAVVRKISLGVAAAHAKGVLHRDLKPANVLYDAETREVIVTDFGLARVSGAAQLSQTGQILGTPAYMSPEQARARQEEIGPLTDVYSLGVILYRLTTGTVPFEGSVLEVLARAQFDVPRPPSEVRPGLDPRIDVLCATAMAKNPEDRFSSAKAFADALAAFLRAVERGGTAESATLPQDSKAPAPSATAWTVVESESVADPPTKSRLGTRAEPLSPPTLELETPRSISTTRRDDRSHEQHRQRRCAADRPRPRQRPRTGGGVMACGVIGCTVLGVVFLTVLVLAMRPPRPEVATPNPQVTPPVTRNPSEEKPLAEPTPKLPKTPRPEVTNPNPQVPPAGARSNTDDKPGAQPTPKLQPPVKWKTYAGEGFTVDFPSDPSKQEIPTGQNGILVKGIMIETPDKKGGMLALSIELPAMGAATSPKALLGQFVDGMEKAMKGGSTAKGVRPSGEKADPFGAFGDKFQITGRREITVDGFPGFDLDMTTGERTGFALGRVVLANTKVVFLFTGHESDAGLAPQSRQFVSSLKITVTKGRP